MAIQDKNKTLKQTFLVLKDAQNDEIKRIISQADFQVGLKDPNAPPRGLVFQPHQAPFDATNKLYNESGTLTFSGVPLLSGTIAGDISEVTAGAGLTGGGSSGDVTVSVKYSDGNDVIISANDGTGITVDSTNDKMLLLDNTDSIVKYVNVDQISAAAGDITGVTAGTGLTGGGTSGTVTLNIDDGVVATLTGSAFSGHVTPSADMQYDLGASDKRWRNMYTGDLHLRNERGDWTIVEEAEHLVVVNNLTGKKYKMMLSEIIE